MNGDELLEHLKHKYNTPNKPIYGNRYFLKWLTKKDGKVNFQFQFLSNIKSIPQDWIREAQNAKNSGNGIDRSWFNFYFKGNHFNDCRVSVVLWLLENEPNP